MTNSLKRFVVVLLIVTVLNQAICCVPGIRVAGAAPASAKRVVVLSIDAAKTDIVYSLASQGILPGFKRIMDEGLYSDGMIVSFPSVTAASHAVISAGADPAITGITGNRLHLPGMRIDGTVDGMNGKYLLAEPLWMTADRQNLRSVVASFPQSTPEIWSGKLKRSMLFDPYGSFLSSLSSSTLYTTNGNIARASYVTLTPAKGWTSMETLGNVGDAYETSLRIGDSTWWVLVYDSGGGHLYNKAAIVPNQKDASQALAMLGEGEWSKPLNTTIVSGGKSFAVAPLFKAVKLRSLNDFRLYRSIMRSLNSDPWFNDAKLAANVWNNVVTKVGMITNGDSFALTNDWIDSDTYMETIERTSNFFRGFTEYLIKNSEWNLLMTYTPIIDDVYHEFLGLITPSMPYYNQETAPRYREYVTRAHTWADEMVQTILRNVDLEQTVVLVLSDHGQWALKKLVLINNILYNAGLIELSRTGDVLWNTVKAYYVGYGQIFVNLKNRESQGTVSNSEYQTVVNSVKETLSAVVDPDTREPVFQKVMSRDEAAALGLGGERAGDVVFGASPGYGASSERPALGPGGGQAPILEAIVPLKRSTGDHGSLPTNKDLLAIFGAIGSNLIHGRIGTFKSTSVAPTVAAALGVEPSPQSTGTALNILETKATTRSASITYTRTETMSTELNWPVTVGIIVIVLAIWLVSRKRTRQ